MTSAKFLNLEEVILNWAHAEYDKTATWRQRRLKMKHGSNNKVLQVTIDWSKVKCTDTTVWRTLGDDVSGSSDRGPAVGRLVPVAALGGAMAARPNTAILFQTSFANNTDDVQEYTLKTEKVTKSSAMSEVESGYTKGLEMGVKLTTPGEIFETNVGFKRELSLTKTEGETFEEELTWGVESVINVKPGHVAEASLVVDEKKQHGEFEVESRLSGMVFVTFTNLKKNNCLVKATGHELGAIVKEYLNREKRKGKDYSTFVEVTDEYVVLTKTKGICHFRYGIKQEVVVNQRPI